MTADTLVQYGGAASEISLPKILARMETGGPVIDEVLSRTALQEAGLRDWTLLVSLA